MHEPFMNEMTDNIDLSIKTKDEIEHTFINSLKIMAFTGPLNILLLCTPIAVISWIAGWPDGVTFVFSLLALAPLAERLGFITEQLALHTNETIGGLLNATFGNATELIVAITALQKGLYRLVQLSLLGSILSNLLLVLGCSFLAGGYYHKTQSFGTISSQINSTLLMLATMAILLPTILTESSEESNLGELGYSRGTSLVLFFTYFAFLYFQLFSHKDLYEERDEKPLNIESEHVALNSNNNTTNNPLYNNHNDNQFNSSIKLNDKNEMKEKDDDDEDEDLLGFNYSLVWLAMITVLIAILSEAISSSIENAASSAGISGIFLAAIVLPIVGNAAEHAGAVMFAIKGKLDLSLGVAVGSSTQIAVCVLPLLVILGWIMNKDLSLNFGSYEGSTLFLTVVSVTFAIKDGRSNWLIGFVLLAAYVIIAIGFYAHHDDDLSDSHAT